MKLSWLRFILASAQKQSPSVIIRFSSLRDQACLLLLSLHVSKHRSIPLGQELDYVIN